MKKIFLCLLIGILLSATAWAKGDVGYENTVRPFLAQRCYKCHGAELQKADQRFDTLTLDFHDEDVVLTWQNIVDMLNLGLMPPYEEPQPELAEASRRLKQGYDELFRRPDDRLGFMSIDKFSRGVPHSGMYRVRVRASAHNQRHPYDKTLRTDENERIRLGIVAGSGRRSYGQALPGSEYSGV